MSHSTGNITDSLLTWILLLVVAVVMLMNAHFCGLLWPFFWKVVSSVLCSCLEPVWPGFTCPIHVWSGQYPKWKSFFLTLTYEGGYDVDSLSRFVWVGAAWDSGVYLKWDAVLLHLGMHPELWSYTGHRASLQLGLEVCLFTILKVS